MSGALVPLPERPAAAERPSEVALDLALRLVVSAVDPTVEAWLRSSLLRWIRSDGSLSLAQCLHLGDSPRRIRLAFRDRWLLEAACYVPGDAWQRAKALAREAERFLRFRWPAWRKLETLPLDAGTPVELALHGAMLAEARLPTSLSSWYRITSQVVKTAK